MQDVWLNGIFVCAIISAVCFVAACVFYFLAVGDGEYHIAKMSARSALAALFLGPLVAVAWPAAIVLAFVGLVVILARGALAR